MASVPLGPPPQMPQTVDEESMRQYSFQLALWLEELTRYINENI